MVSPAQKKQAVVYVFGKRLCSERRACRYLGVHRSTCRYPVKLPLPHQVQLHPRIVALSWQYPRYGYRRIRAVLEQEGWLVSRKQVQRIRRKEGLKVRPKPQRIPRQGVSTGWPTQATHRNQVWTWDFIFDRTDKGSTLKLTMLDESTRKGVAIRVERQIRSEQVLATLWQAMTTYGIPEHIRSDNGSDRAQIVPGPKEEVKEEVEMSPESTSEGDPTPAQRRHRLAWAVLLARVWAIDVTDCPACGGRMKIVAAVTDRCSIRR